MFLRSNQKRKLFIIVVLFAYYTLSVFSQEIVTQLTLQSPSFKKKDNNILSVINSSQNEFAVFLNRYNGILGLSYTKLLENPKLTEFNYADSDLNFFLNGLANKDVYLLLCSNMHMNKFCIRYFNFNKDTVTENILDFSLTDERFLESITYKNKFYIFTIRIVSSLITIYTINKNGIEKVHSIDLSGHKFSNTWFSTLYDEFYTENWSGLMKKLSITKINSNNQNPIDVVSNYNKIYLYGDKVFITIDNNLENTVVISIDLHNFSAEVKSYIHNNIESLASDNVTSNSFLYEKFLFQVIIDKNELYTSIYDLMLDSLISEYHIRGNEEIWFGNSPVKYVRGEKFLYFKYAEIDDKTRWFLRKLSISNAGISVSKVDNRYQVDIGGCRRVDLVFDLGDVNSYFFTTLLDENNFKHIEDDVPNNVFEEILEFNMNKEVVIFSPHIFHFDKYYFLGYYPDDRDTFILRKFDE